MIICMIYTMHTLMQGYTGIAFTSLTNNNNVLRFTVNVKAVCDPNS